MEIEKTAAAAVQSSARQNTYLHVLFALAHVEQNRNHAADLGQGKKEVFNEE